MWHRSFAPGQVGRQWRGSIRVLAPADGGIRRRGCRGSPLWVTALAAGSICHVNRVTPTVAPRKICSVDFAFPHFRILEGATSGRDPIYVASFYCACGQYGIRPTLVHTFIVQWQRAEGFDARPVAKVRGPAAI